MPAWVGGWAYGMFARSSRRNRTIHIDIDSIDRSLLQDKIELETHYQKCDIPPKEFNEKYDAFIKRCKRLYRSGYIKTLSFKEKNQNEVS